MPKFLFNLGSLFLLFSLAGTQPKVIHSFSSIDPLEFRIEMESHSNAILLDVQTRKQYKKQHIAGSVLADEKKVLLSIADTLDLDQPLLVYCNEGDRSFTACMLLTDKGFKKVYNLEGGLKAWEEHGFPVVD